MKRRCRCLITRPVAAERENGDKLYCRCCLCLGRTRHPTGRRIVPSGARGGTGRRYVSPPAPATTGSSEIINFKRQHVFVVRFHPVLCLTRYHILTERIIHQSRPPWQLRQIRRHVVLRVLTTAVADMLCCGRFPPQWPTCCVARATHRSVTPSNTVDYALSAWARSAIFLPDPTTVAALPTPSEVRVAQERDQALQRWIRHHHTSTSRFMPGLVECEDNTKVWADISVTPARILVPTALQHDVFDSLHCLANPVVKAGMTLIKRSYWWQGIGKDVARWTRSREACQKAKVHKHTKAPLERLPAPTKRFSHIRVDLVGPLNPACEGKNTLLTVIDRWTGWPEAIPMMMHGDAANTKACAKVLVRQWIARWGVPDIITSDRWSQFASDLWLEICRFMGIARDPSTSYHPQQNGKVERMHRCLKNSLRARLLGIAHWLAELPWVMLGLRAAANLDTGVSLSMLVTGQQPALPG